MAPSPPAVSLNPSASLYLSRIPVHRTQPPIPIGPTGHDVPWTRSPPCARPGTLHPRLRPLPVRRPTRPYVSPPPRKPSACVPYTALVPAGWLHWTPPASIQHASSQPHVPCAHQWPQSQPTIVRQWARLGSTVRQPGRGAARRAGAQGKAEPPPWSLRFRRYQQSDYQRMPSLHSSATTVNERMQGWLGACTFVQPVRGLHERRAYVHDAGVTCCCL